MRSLRWLLLLVILGIIGVVTATYRSQKAQQVSHAPKQPVALAPSLNGSAEDWQWSQSAAGKPVVQIRAKNLKQEKDSAQTLLEGLQLKLFQKDGEHFDLVKSASAHFSQAESRLFSDGAVEITLGVPKEGVPPTHRLVSVHSSGLTFESKTGKAVTDRATQFTFENGDGKCEGATYDPQTKELHLLRNVELHLRGTGPKSKMMKVQAGELTYKEAGSTIWLTPWSRLTRDQTVLDAASSTINLKDGVIESIDAVKARGIDKLPTRQLDYAADALHVSYSPDGELQKISGVGNARLLSHADSGATNISADTVDLEFTQQNNEATLTRVNANGNGMIESKPVAAKDGRTPENRVLRSAVIELTMRPGGREILVVATHTPGTLEFLPNGPAQHRRILDGERMTIDYAPQNQIQAFRSVHVRTQTFPTQEESAKAKNPKSSVAITTSDNLAAAFEPKTGQMTRMKQWDNFVYEEADRKARATTATLDSDRNVMDLETNARVWDATGATSADHIELMQKTGDFTATGHVNTSRLPEKKKGSNDLLNGDEPIQATAQKMTAANRNRLVHYEGSAVLWQAADRIQAERIDIDREKRTLVADGHVVTQFLDKDEDKEKGGPVSPKNSPVFTLVRAAKLDYAEGERLAHYTGGVTLNRPDLIVKGADLRAYLNNKGAAEDSRIHHAIADGAVEIVQIAADRKRIGTGDHAEYYTADEKIILRGGVAQLVDSKRGNTTRGAELTYFADDDRLLVNGAPEKPVSSRLHRKQSPK